MAREIDISGIFIHGHATRCFHTCRYCQLSTPRAIEASFARYAALVDRFIDWKLSSGRHDFEIAEWYGNSHDYDRETQAGVRRLSERQWPDAPLHVVLLGGVTHRPMEAMRDWLLERQSVGIDTVVASFPGHGERHDYWNHKRGNYRFHLDTLQLAASMGMRLQQRMFLIRDTIGGMERLIDDLEAIEAVGVERWSYPLFYSGLARHLEKERLTERELDALPARLRDTFRDDHPHWRSERRWVEQIRAGQNDSVERVPLILDVDETSLAWAETRSCDEIVDELSARLRATYATMPSRRTLCDEGYAQPESDRVYMRLEQMDHVWLDRYLQAHPGRFDLRHTGFH